MELTLRGGSGRKVSPTLQRRLLRAARRALEAMRVERCEVGITLVRDAEMRALNRRWAGEDHATDVLSFSQREGLAPAGPAGGAVPLGDVVISVDTAARQALAADHSLLDELVHLTVHGLAHLCGLDHRTPAEERRMFGWEARVRRAVIAAGPVRRVRRPAGARA